MNKQRIFQYAILWHPNEKEVEEGMVSKFLSKLQTVLASDHNSLTIRAAMEIPHEYKDKLSQVEIVIRPF